MEGVVHPVCLLCTNYFDRKPVKTKSNEDDSNYSEEFSESKKAFNTFWKLLVNDEEAQETNTLFRNGQPWCSECYVALFELQSIQEKIEAHQRRQQEIIELLKRLLTVDLSEKEDLLDVACKQMRFKLVGYLTSEAEAIKDDSLIKFPTCFEDNSSSPEAFLFESDGGSVLPEVHPTVDSASEYLEQSVEEPVPIKRKRGRPRKNSQPPKHLSPVIPERTDRSKLRYVIITADLDDNDPDYVASDLSDVDFEPRRKKSRPASSSTPIFSKVCEICSEAFTSKYSYDLHIKRHNTQKRLKCNICGQGYDQMKDFKDHSRVHSNERPFPCDICSLSFKYKRNLREHRRQVHKIKPQPPIDNLLFGPKQMFPCEFCDKLFGFRSKLNDHLLIHVNKNPSLKEKVAKLLQLDTDFKETEAVSEAEEETHSAQPEINSSPPSPLDPPDPLAPPKPAALKKKKKRGRIPKEDPKDCTICGERLPSKYSFEIHMRRHSGRNPFTCEVCSKTFGTKHDLKNHKNVHSDERPYHCEFCDFKFKHKRNLREHRKTVHKDKVEVNVEDSLKTTNLRFRPDFIGPKQQFPCEFCDKIYPKRSQMLKHLQCHTKDKKLKRRILEIFSFSPKTITEFSAPLPDAIEDEEVDEKPEQSKTVESSSSDEDEPADPILAQARKDLKCHICSQKFARSNTFDDHVRRHTGEKGWICEHCGKAFHSQREYKRHSTEVHVTDRAYQCEYCVMNFKSRRTMRKHQRAKHSEFMQPVDPERKLKFTNLDNRPDFIGPKIAFPCEYCGKVFQQRSRLKKHLETSGHPDFNGILEKYEEGFP